MPKRFRRSRVQSVLLPKSKFTRKEARTWLRKHKFKTKLEPGRRFWRARQLPPKKGKQFRIIQFNKNIKAVLMLENEHGLV